MGKSYLLFIPTFGIILILLSLLVVEWGFQEKIKTEKEPILMLENVDIPVCPDFGGFKLSKTPKYSFSSDKYLGHWLTHGPNNQIVDFRSGLFASIAMKRALLPPLFYSHPNSGSEDRLEMFHVLDVEALSKLVNLVLPFEVAKTCSELSDSGATIPTYYHQNIPQVRITDLKSYFGFSNEKQDYFDKKLEMNFPKRGDFDFGMIKKLMNYSENCILQDHPVRNIKKEPELWNEIVRATARPKYVRKAAEWIREMLFGEHEFAAVHWRYNNGDWGKHCPKWPSCRIFKLGIETPEIFAQKITKLLTEKNIFKIYIAAPPDQATTVANFRYEIQKIDAKFEVLVGTDAEKLLEARRSLLFPNCGFLKKHFNNIFSITEQEICFHSKFFITADQSTWSGNIRQERIAWAAQNSTSENLELSKVLDLKWD